MPTPIIMHRHDFNLTISTRSCRPTRQRARLPVTTDGAAGQQAVNCDPFTAAPLYGMMGLDQEVLMPDYPRPRAKSALVREALREQDNARSIRMIERAVWKARQDGIRLIDAPEEIAVALEWLGTLYLLEDKPARAISPLKDALKWQRRRRGTGNPQVRYLIARLTDAYEAQGKTVKAIGRLEGKLTERLRDGVTSRQAARSRRKLFDAYWAAGRIHDAFGLYREAVAACEREYGPDAPESIAMRSELAWEYLDAELPDGVPLLERNLQAAQRAGLPVTELAFKRSELGMVYTWYGRATDAVQILEEGLASIADLDGAQPRIIRKELLRLSSEASALKAQQQSRPPKARLCLS